MWRAVSLVATLWLAACGHNVGDSCKNNVDCSPLGDRFCDTAPPGGYCTIENCDIDTCPSEAVCVRFFSPLMNEPCHPPEVGLLAQNDCTYPDERCVCQDSVNGKCASKDPKDPDKFYGHCAPSSTERRWCQKKCSNSGDCREGYGCFETGSGGAESIPTFDMGSGKPAKFCAPKPSP
jgi:hypothetical protein